MAEVDGIELIRWLGGRDPKPSVLLAASYDLRYAQAAKDIATHVARINVTIVTQPFDEVEILATLADVLTTTITDRIKNGHSV